MATALCGSVVCEVIEMRDSSYMRIEAVVIASTPEMTSKAARAPGDQFGRAN